MIKGFVNNLLEPIIDIELMLGKRNLTRPAVIDTGFNGYLSVPQSLISESGWEFAGYEDYEIANGEIVKEKMYAGEIVFDGKKHRVIILSSNAKDVLVGTRLLAGFTLSIDFKRRELKIC